MENKASNFQSQKRKLIVEHFMRPKFRINELNLISKKNTFIAEADNSFCADEIGVILNIKNNIVTKINFFGQGCAIATSFADVFCQAIDNKDLEFVNILILNLKLFLKNKLSNLTVDFSKEPFNYFEIFDNIHKFRNRVNCADLILRATSLALLKYDIHLKKNILRLNLKTKLSTLTKENISSKSDKIVETLLNIKEIKSASSIAFFYPLKNEVNLLKLAKKFSKSKVIAFPKITGEELKFYKINNFINDFNTDNSFGIREPKVNLKFVNNFDVILIPGLGFDNVTKHRIGRGKGFYDRYLKNYKGYKIGICFKEQLISNIPNEEHDIIVDKIVAK